MMATRCQQETLTHIELIWHEKQIEHWIRFGRDVAEKILDRRRRILSFAPNTIVAYVRWASGDFGTIVSRIDILRTVRRGEAFSTVPYVRPGGEILPRASGWPKAERVLQAIDAAAKIGLDAAAPVFSISQLDIGNEKRARTLWDTETLRREYRNMSAALGESAARLSHLAPREAMAESFDLGGRGIRQIVLDPLLPEPIVPAGELASLVEAMRQYDRRGRELWRSFMKEHNAPHLRSPMNPQPLAPRAAAAGGR